VDGEDASPPLVTLAWSVEPFQGQGRPVPLAPPQPFQCFGVLNWGVSAAQHQCRFDLGRGGALTVTATAVHFQAENLATLGPDIRVYGTASYDTKPGQLASRLALTEPFTGLEQGAPVLVAVPPFATVVTLFLDTWVVLDRGEVTLRFADLDGVTVYEYTPTNCTVADAAELPNNCYFVTLVKIGAGPISGALVFQLSL
jgi:hypothetical protein